PRGVAPRRRRPRSSRRAGKPSTRRRGSGRWMARSGGTRHAERRNDADHHPGSNSGSHLLESRMIGNDPVRFGGRRRKRSHMATAPTAYPTLQAPKTKGTVSQVGRAGKRHQTPGGIWHTACTCLDHRSGTLARLGGTPGPFFGLRPRRPIIRTFVIFDALGSGKNNPYRTDDPGERRLGRPIRSMAVESLV